MAQIYGREMGEEKMCVEFDERIQKMLTKWVIEGYNRTATYIYKQNSC